MEIEARVAAGPGASEGDGPVDRGVAESWIEQSLRERGLTFGAPLPAPEVDPPPDSIDAHTCTMLVALRHQLELVLEVACLYGRDLGAVEARKRDLLLLLAVLADRLDLARELEASLSSKRSPQLRRVARSLGAGLADRLAESRTRPPWTLGDVYLDEARRLAALAMDLYERRLSLDDVQARLGGMGARARLTLVEALAGVARADGDFDPAEQRLIEDRIALSGFSWRERKAAARALKAPRRAAELAADLAEEASALFVLEQVVLASHADGLIAEEESRYVADLATALGFEAEVVAGVEADVAAFYERHKQHLDQTPSANMMRALYSKVSDRVADLVRLNADRIVQEVKETGELSVLLVRAGRGERLTDEERAKVVSQLLDIARTIPALAIFALPGGGVLLPILIRILPFNVLPSAFVGPPVEAAPEVAPAGAEAQ